jgi:hypothetical protein
MKTKLKVIVSVAMIVAILASVLPLEMAGAASSAATVKGAEKTFAALKARYEKADTRAEVIWGLVQKYQEIAGYWTSNTPAKELQKFYDYAGNTFWYTWSCAWWYAYYHPGFQNGKVTNLSEANGTNKRLDNCLDSADYWAAMAFAQSDYIESGAWAP